MNDTATSVSGASLLPGSTGAFTAMHLAIIAILIVLTLIAILYGMKLARRRHSAAREIDRHNAHVEAAAPAPPAPAIAPVAPALPPLSDQPAVGTAPRAPIADEPLADAAPLDASPPAEAASVPAGTAAGDRPVTLLKGLGPKVAARLGELGINTVAQLAGLDEAAATRLDDQLGAFKGRMARDRWIEQARLLAAGDKAGFEAAFGRL